jgi:hypothetical protein
MSAYTTAETEFDDPVSVKAALMELGYSESQIEMHDEPQHLYGYVGDQRSQKANIIIRRKDVGTSSNDFGMVKGPNGKYKILVSDYDRGQMPRKHGCRNYTEFEGRLKQLYTVKAVTKAAKKRSWSKVNVQMGKVGEQVRIRMERYV